MIGSLRVGSVLGIKIRVHFLLLLVIGYILITQDAHRHEVSPFLTILMLFGAVTLHELGHSIVAQSFGIRVLDITLWPLGGMARMSEVPESSKIEGLVAVAGPIVNFILAALTAPVWLWASAAGTDRVWLLGVTQTFLFINLLMGAFNLIPAFPTDGGRILRAFLGRRGDWVGATSAAVQVGRVFSVLIALTGLVMGDVVLVVIAIWLWWMGAQEWMAVRMRHSSTQMDDLRNATRAAAAGWGWSSSSTAGPPAEDPESARTRGYTAEEIERLERFRGNLRNFKSQ